MSDKKKKTKKEEPAAAAPAKETKVKKGQTFEEAKETYDAAVTERKAARAALTEFETKNGLMPKKKYGDHEKFGKAWKPLEKVWKAAKEKEEAAEKAMKSLKPQKTHLSGKYDYPEGMTSDEKKKFRAAQRILAKKTAKGEAKEEKPKKGKADKAGAKSKKDAAPAVEEAPAKKDKSGKKKKKKVAAED